MISPALQRLATVPFLTADLARTILPPDEAADPTRPTIEGQILLNAGPSERGWHRMQTALVCPQLWSYKYHPDLADDPRVEHVRHEASPPLIRGSLLHIGLAHFYRRVQALQTRTDPDRFHTPRRAVELLAHQEDNRPGRERYPIRWASFVAEAQAAVSAYADYFRSREQWQILGVEYPLRLLVPTDGWSLDPAVTHFLLTLRFDLIWWQSDGLCRVGDHKCLPGAAEILTPTGPTTVQDMAPQNPCVARDGVDIDAHTRLATAHRTPAGVQDVYEIALTDGTREQYGYKHPIYTRRGWRQAADVCMGDEVAVCLPPDVPDLDIPDDVLRVLGLAMSDGGRRKYTEQSYEITATSPQTRAYLIGALDRLGDSWASQFDRGADRRIRLHASGTARRIVETLGIDKSLAADKAMPGRLWGLSRRQAGILLGSFWEGDGAAYFGTVENDKAPPVRLVFSSRAYRLCQGVRHLLLQMGIISNITTSQVAGAPYHQVVVVGTEAKARFLSAVVDGEIDSPSTRDGGRVTRAGRTLEPAADLLRSLRDRKAAGGANNPSLTGTIRWVPVRSVLCTGQAECFDIEVPGPELFLMASGVLTHNTRGRKDPRQERGYARDGQFQALRILGAETFGRFFAGVLTNYVTYKHSPDIRVFGADGEYAFSFERMVPPVLGRRIETFGDTIRWGEYQQQAFLRMGLDPFRYPKVNVGNGACEHRYGPCPGAYLCDYGPNGIPIGVDALPGTPDGKRPREER